MAAAHVVCYAVEALVSQRQADAVDIVVGREVKELDAVEAEIAGSRTGEKAVIDGGTAGTAVEERAEVVGTAMGSSCGLAEQETERSGGAAKDLFGEEQEERVAG